MAGWWWKNISDVRLIRKIPLLCVCRFPIYHFNISILLHLRLVWNKLSIFAKVEAHFPARMADDLAIAERRILRPSGCRPKKGWHYALIWSDGLWRYQYWYLRILDLICNVYQAWIDLYILIIYMFAINCDSHDKELSFSCVWFLIVTAQGLPNKLFVTSMFFFGRNLILCFSQSIGRWQTHMYI